MQKGFISLSSPIWANYGREGYLSISCFNSFIEDSMESILYTTAEIGMMSKYGGGTSAYLGKIRPRGSKISKGGTSDGSVHFSRLLDTVVDVSKQGSTRRGSCAIYQDIDHPDIEEFLEIKHESSNIQNLFTGVCVSNSWLSQMEDGDIEKRRIWAKVLQSRQRVGMPYIFFKDNVNEGKPQVYKDLELEILSSQLCSEVLLPSNEKESFVCCLASLNAYYFEEWKDTKVVEVLTYFLDRVLDDFIETASRITFLERAVNFTKRHRAIGLGVLGYHSYLQKNSIPFESLEANYFNIELFSTIKSKAYKESERLAELYGPAPIFLEEDSLEIPRRNTTLCSVAPTTSSSFILGQISQGIEPLRSNYYVRDMKKKIIFKNPELEKILDSYSKNDKETWNIIMNNFGSVQSLDFLSINEKNVFKTFSEISQFEVLKQAASRQKYIDQGQSLNLMIHPLTATRDVNALILYAAKNGIKTLYYQHTINAAQEFARDLSCVNCES